MSVVLKQAVDELNGINNFNLREQHMVQSILSFLRKVNRNITDRT